MRERCETGCARGRVYAQALGGAVDGQERLAEESGYGREVLSRAAHVCRVLFRGGEDVAG